MGADQSKENPEKAAAAAAADSKATEAEKAAKAAQLQKLKEAPKAPPSVGHTLWRTCLLAKGMLFLVVGAMHLLEENGGLEAMDFTFLKGYPAPGKVSGLCLGGKALPSPDAEPIEMLLVHTTAILGCNMLFRAAILISTSVQDISQIALMVSTYEAVTSSLTLMVQSMKPPGTGAEGSPDSAPPELMWVMMILDFVCFLAVNGIIGAPSKPEPKAKKAAPPVVDKPVVKAPNADAKPEGQPKK